MRSSFPFALIALTACASLWAADPASATAAVKPYPLTTCMVMGEPLDSMGGAVAIVHEGQEVKFCCKGCIKRFTDNPAKYLAKLPAVAASATAAAQP